MTIGPADADRDWDDDERAALAGFEADVAALRARHAGDPPVDLLTAGQEGILPEDLQADVDRHLAASRWSRTLVDGIGSPDVSLDRDDEARLLERIDREARRVVRPRMTWLWPALAAAAVPAAIGVALFQGGRPPASPSATVAVAPPASARVPSPSSPGPAPTPTFVLALAKPPITLSAPLLRSAPWRGAGAPDVLLADLKPALDAFRGNDYRTAEQRLSELARAYPDAVEVFYYQGVSRLFLQNPQGAAESLARAAAIDEPSLAPDVAWYRAIAEERAGHRDAARAQVSDLCRRTSAYTSRACAAVKALE